MGRSPASFLRLGELLYFERSWPDRAAIAHRLGIHRAILSPWLNLLFYHRAIAERDGLRVDRGRLVTLLTAHRMASLRPEAPFEAAVDAEEAHRLLQAAGIPHCLGFFSAANLWSFFEPRADVHVYVPRGRVSSVRAALDQRGPRSRRPATVQVYVEGLAGLGRAERAGAPVTSPFQTVIDLRAHPEGGAHAAFLESNLLPRLRSAHGSPSE